MEVDKKKPTKNALADVLHSIKWAHISTQYFGKSRSWFSQRLNGYDGNGAESDFNDEELSFLKSEYRKIDNPDLNAMVLEVLLYNLKNEEIPEYVGYFFEGTKYGKARDYALEFVADIEKIDRKHKSRKAAEQIQLEDKTAVITYQLVSYNRYFSKTSKDRIKKNTYIKHFLYYAPEGVKVVIDKPIMSAFGDCINGDCQNGKGTIRLENMGDFEGTFKDV